MCVCVCKQNLALNDPQGLKFNKHNQTKPNRIKVIDKYYKVK